MSARVSVTVGSDGVLAVKTATTPDELADLGGEAARLRQAAHPGVVRLVEHRMANDTAALYTGYAGESVVTWRGTVPQAAGLLAAVATIVADLHDIGILHGRLDETHVLVGPDSRPRLCGFSPAPRDATPQEDVAALGRLFAVLLDRATSSDRRGAFRWPRAQVAERRALAQLVADATDLIVDRRPTARAFARSILATVPHAQLTPTGPRADTSRSAHSSQRPKTSPTALPASADSADVPAAADLGVSEGPRSGDLVEAPAVPAVEASDAGGAEADSDLVPVAGYLLGTGQDEVGALGAFGVEVGDDVVAIGGEPDAVFGDQTTAEVEEIFVDRPWQEEEPHLVSHGSGAHVPRPRPPRPWLGRGLTLALFVVLLVAVAAGLSIRSARDDAGAPGSPVSSSRANERPCAPASPPSADTDGDGCGETIQVVAGRVVVDGVSFAVGDPDDSVAVGDWDCDGRATPAAYRPSTGDVFVFSHWAAEGHPFTVEPVAQVAGGRTLVVAPSTTSGSASCDTLAVELTSGGHEVVEIGQ